jgi:hypothetical protein
VQVNGRATARNLEFNSHNVRRAAEPTQTKSASKLPPTRRCHPSRGPGCASSLEDCLGLNRLARLRNGHEHDTIFYVCRSVQRARTVWRWAQARAFLADRKTHFRVTPLELAVRDGLKAEFVDLRG